MNRFHSKVWKGGEKIIVKEEHCFTYLCKRNETKRRNPFAQTHTYIYIVIHTIVWTHECFSFRGKHYNVPSSAIWTESDSVLFACIHALRVLSLSLSYAYIFNAFISGHVGKPEIAGRYLAVFQVLISSRAHPPWPGGGGVAPLCKLRPLHSALAHLPGTKVARDAPNCPATPSNPLHRCQTIEDESLDIVVVVVVGSLRVTLH